ncbi:S-layer homology domain-containing protein [Jeotgalibacillus malaysiensis]|uniref:S-layer homology domain-containing protein n=1 Tax=Jeotgalibacillus malaysiensis TaxID=1508404 RepID=UPI00384E8441
MLNKLTKGMIATIGAGAMSLGLAAGVEATEPYSPFTDVSKDSAAYEPIKNVFHKEIMSGYEIEQADHTFKYEMRPYQNVTRAQAAKMMAIGLGNIHATQDISAFPDIDETYWAHDYITLLEKEGVVSGDREGNFNPVQSLNRAQIAKMLVEGFDLPFDENDTDTGFNDVDADDWEAPYVKALVDAGLTTGTTPDTFSSYQSVTRYQLAAFIDRFYKNFELDKDLAFVQVRGTFKEMQDVFYHYVNQTGPLPLEDPLPYESFQDEMRETITMNIEPDVKENFINQCRACDGINYGASVDYKVNYELIENTKDRITIQYVDLGNALKLVTDYTISIVNEDGKWKLDQYEGEHVERDSEIFTLSVEEALNYVESINRKYSMLKVIRVDLIEQNNDLYTIRIVTPDENYDVVFDRQVGFVN